MFKCISRQQFGRCGLTLDWFTTREIVIDFAIHQLLGPLISTINLVERTPTLDLSLLIGQPKLSLEHLFHVFLWLLIGYLTSFIVFFCELIWFRCHTHSKIISCEIRDRKVSRMEACRKISASKTTGEWLRITRSSYKRKWNNNFMFLSGSWLVIWWVLLGFLQTDLV